MKKGELYNVKVGDIRDTNSSLIVDLPDTTTRKPRQFAITDNFYKICKKYISLRPAGMACKDQRFFVNYKNGKCTAQFVGINKFGRLVQDIAKFLKLPNPESYTGHSYRRTSATGVANVTNDLLAWQQYSGSLNDPINRKIEIPEIFYIVEGGSSANQVPPLRRIAPAPPKNYCESGTHKIQNFMLTEEHKMVNSWLQATIYFQNCSIIFKFREVP